MDADRRPAVTPPWWVRILIVLVALPVLAWPTLMSLAGDSAPRVLLWIYPIYVLLAAAMAWVSWRERPWVTWTLLIVLLLTHAGIWALALLSQNVNPLM